MALVPVRKESKAYPWNIKDSMEPRCKLPVINKVPLMDYDVLTYLTSIQGLASKDNPESSPDAHRLFMENYHRMFIPEAKKVHFPVQLHKKAIAEKSSSSEVESLCATVGNTTKTKPARKRSPAQEFTHNIKDYLPLLHRECGRVNTEQTRANSVKTLRRLLRKLPFERTAADNGKVFSILKTFRFFEDNISDTILKELCVVALLEIWKEQDFTVFGSTGLHMVLRGKVVPLSKPYIYTGLEEDELGFLPATPDSKDIDIVILDFCKAPLVFHSTECKQLEVGDCFGTLQKIQGTESMTRMLSVKTVDANCEFMKISVSDYERVITQIQQREQTEKLNLLLSCSQYKLWPRQPLQEVASLIQWLSYPPNTVIVSEGYKSPFIGFIKCGECHVLRQVDVLHTLRNGKKEKKMKQVVMGKLRMSDSFGEISLLQDKRMTCSVVTATDIQLGVITPEKLQELDEVTVQLFKHSSTPTFGNLTKENIQNEYIKQEQKRAWNEFKHSVVVDVINANGIRPGYGKWAK